MDMMRCREAIRTQINGGIIGHDQTASAYSHGFSFKKLAIYIPAQLIFFDDHAEHTGRISYYASQSLFFTPICATALKKYDTPPLKA